MKRTAACLALALLPLLSVSSHAQSPSPLPALQPEILHSFTASVGDFSNGVVPGGDGNFYGLSITGGKFGRGAFFQVTPAGVITVFASFGDPDSSARGIFNYVPGFRRLVSDGGGFFYSTTDRGGRFDLGTIFRVSLSGTVETLVDFSGETGTAPGQQPFSGLARGLDGNFYGMTSSGGPKGHGVIFRVSADGRYQVLVEFTGRTGAAPGDFPFYDLLPLTGGGFIGTTNSGGRANAGVIFQLSEAGFYQVLGEFTSNSGAFPGNAGSGALAQGLDGSVYGVYNKIDLNGGGSGSGLWKVAPGTQVAAPFVDISTDANGMSLGFFVSSLVVLPSGNLVALSDSIEAYSFGPGLFSITPAGQVLPLEDLSSIGLTYPSSFGNYLGVFPDGSGGLIGLLGNKLFQRPGAGPSTVLATFTTDGGSGLGVFPRDALLVAADGTVYGRTDRGSTNDYGTLFKRPGAGPLTNLLSLTSEDAIGRSTFSNNYSPLNANPLAFHSSGDLLFASARGGANGVGAIFRITPMGNLSTAADFVGGTNVIELPAGGLTPDGLGNFYGRAYFDDVNFTTHDVVYRLTASNQLELLTTLDQFGVEQFGGASFAPMTFDTSNSFLGILPFKGKDGQGLIYRTTATGQLSTVLELGKTTLSDSFPAGPLLREPTGSFILPTQSSFGSSHSHDDSTRGGSLIRLPVAGAPQKIVAFTGREGDKPGAVPSAPLVRDNGTGRVYGVTLEGGDDNIGVLYRLDANGTYTPLHRFHLGPNAEDLGGPPSTGLTLASNGYIYGGTYAGGTGGGGTLFRFPTSPQGSATTDPVLDFDANSATFKGSLTSNGYGGEYWFTYTEQPSGSPVESPRLPLAGFNGPQSIEAFIATLKGHRDYSVQLNATLGVGSDTVAVPGGTQTFTTPNGAPRVADDTILVSATAENAPGEVLTNDVEPDDDTLSIQSFTQGTYGSVTQVGQTLVYTPTFDFFDPEAAKGRDSFTYTVTDSFSGAGGPLTATATVTVLSDGSIAGDYAGLLVEEQPASAFIPRGAEAVTANQIAAGFASIALGKGRKFSARFQIGAKTISVKGSMAEGRGTRVSQTRNGFDGEIRPTAGGVEGRITFNGRTLVLRMGQAFAASQGTTRPISDYTIRFTPTLVEDPVGTAGLPAGSGFAVIRELKKSRALLVGVLPDGTAFSKGTVIDGEKEMDFFTTLYKTKTGTFGGQITIDANENIDGTAGIPTQWKKAPQPRDTRFAGGFETEMTAFGGKYVPPAKGQPPLPVGSSALLATFDRGGLFEPLSTRFTFTGSKPVADTNNNGARTKPKFSARAGTVTGTFIPVKKPVKFRGLIVQRSQSVAGFFLGTADAGSVTMAIEP